MSFRAAMERQPFSWVVGLASQQLSVAFLLVSVNGIRSQDSSAFAECCRWDHLLTIHKH